MIIIKSPVWSGHWAPEHMPDSLPSMLFMPNYITNITDIGNTNHFWQLVFKFYRNGIKDIDVLLAVVEGFDIANRPSFPACLINESLKNLGFMIQIWMCHLLKREERMVSNLINMEIKKCPTLMI